MKAIRIILDALGFALFCLIALASILSCAAVPVAAVLYIIETLRR